MSENLSGFLLNQGEGSPIDGTAFRYKVRGQDTGGRLMSFEALMQPGEFIPPHTHTREDEFTLVYRGTIGVRIGTTEYLVPEGALIFKPRGLLHSMWNPTAEAAILFETITPAGFEGFFEEMGRLIVAHGRVAPTMVDTIAAKYGVTFHWEVMPEILARVNRRPDQ